MIFRFSSDSGRFFGATHRLNFGHARTSFAPETISSTRNKRDQFRTKTQQNQ
jgi:hypothetical protein